MLKNVSKLIPLLLLMGCSNPPAKSVIEQDLCKARASFKLLEVADPRLQPAPGSIREKLEEAEDTLCASK